MLTMKQKKSAWCQIKTSCLSTIVHYIFLDHSTKANLSSMSGAICVNVHDTWNVNSIESCFNKRRLLLCSAGKKMLCVFTNFPLFIFVCFRAHSIHSRIFHLCTVNKDSGNLDLELCVYFFLCVCVILKCSTTNRPFSQQP